MFEIDRCDEKHLNRSQVMVVTIIPILLLSSALNLSQVVLPAHGAITGLVCIADPTGSKCPETPPILTPAAPSDTQITIGVFVNSSAALNAFEVILVADHMIIKPWKVDLTNSILGASPSITAQCIGGVARPGFACSSLDGPDTLHFRGSRNNLVSPNNRTIVQYHLQYHWDDQEYSYRFQNGMREHYESNERHANMRYDYIGNAAA